MDVALEMMLVATALFQEAETPLGQCGLFVNTEQGEDIAAGIKEGFERLENIERVLPNERDKMYTSLRKTTQWYEVDRLKEKS